MISIRTHALLDYMVGILLVIAPWLLGFSAHTGATLTALLTGLAIIVYSLMTDYRYAVANILPLKVHLILDISAGLFLVISPLLFRFSEYVFWPHVTIGLLALLVVLFTRRRRKTNVLHP